MRTFLPALYGAVCMRVRHLSNPGILALGLLGLIVPSTVLAAIPAGEREVLVNLYVQTGGAKWVNNTGWNGAPGSECTWYGITCDDTQSHVVGIALGSYKIDYDYDAKRFIFGNNLVGTLPSITALAKLKNFSVDGNRLSGQIPTLSGLTELETFNVSGPYAEGGMLEPIDAQRQGQLSGSIPEIKTLTHLKSLAVGNNLLTGVVPSFEGLTGLRGFDAPHNSLTGPLPSLSGLSNLISFDVGDNQLTGPIPSLEGLESLHELTLFKNQLTGTIPDLSGAPNLFYFYASYNQLSGRIPSLAGLKRLDTFSVEYNRLDGAFPQLPDTPDLYSVDVSHNRLTGSFPSMPASGVFGGVDVSFNLLSGDLPPLPRIYGNRTRYWLCPNLFNRTESNEWDALAPGPYGKWYSDCLDAKVNLNQFGLTGTWYNPATSGQGFMLQGFPDLYGAGQGMLFGGWFTFGQDYGPTNGYRQSWYSFQGSVDASVPYAEFDLYTGQGGNFAAPPRIAPSKAGKVLFALSDCSHATLRYEFNDSVPSNLRVIPLTRLGGNSRCAPAGDNGTASSILLLSGSWYDSNTSGQGLMIHVDPGSTLLFAAWYTYAKDGKGGQRWFTLQTNQFAPGVNAIGNVEILTATDGLIDDPKPVTSQRHLGTADIAFQDCSTMTLSYRFDSGENAGESGTLHLTRLGPAPVGCKLP